MIPRHHAYTGLIFGMLLLPIINWKYILVIMFANFFIDFDHYLSACVDTKKVLSIKESLIYYGVPRYNMQVFHTIEVHALILLLTLIHPVFYCIFLGMVLHSFTDFVFMYGSKTVYSREYWLIKHIRKLYI
jgi:hypothetical protein